MVPVFALGWAAGGRASGDSSLRAGSNKGELASRFPSERAPGSRGEGVITGPRTAAISTVAKRSAEGVVFRLGACEPADPGTATVANAAMSAAIATTLGRRTSREPYHRSAESRDCVPSADHFEAMPDSPDDPARATA